MDLIVFLDDLEYATISTKDKKNELDS